MGWEERAGRRYLYRKRRHGRQIRSEYVGGGELGDAVATLDAVEREQRTLARVAEQEEGKRQDAFDAQVDQFLALTRLIASEALIAQGYHQHSGQWRKRRNE